MTLKKTQIAVRSSAAEYLTYVSTVGENSDKLEVRYQDENLWLTQKSIAALYDVSPQTINSHLKKIFDDNELLEKDVTAIFNVIQTEGNRKVSRDVLFYNLQMIIAVGFKVNNDKAVQFRKWANQIVK